MTPPNKTLSVLGRKFFIRTWRFWSLLLYAVALWNLRRFMQAAYPGDRADLNGERGRIQTTNLKPHIHLTSYLH